MPHLHFISFFPQKKKEKAGTKKKKKDADAPKKPPTPYMLFCNAKRAEVKAENPEIKQTELLQVCAMD